MSRGAEAENLAERYLVAKGLEILERNFRCRGGEIDLIARDGETLVFVEVRLRGNPRFGGAAASIDRRKQERWQHAARCYLARCHGEPACRFDAIVMSGLEAARIEWLRDVL
ncbi:MAG: YraN family protein [Betaproteobacteria bacterium]|nr:YraN family protein [Betaproteobacteria bacterium]